MREDHRRKRTDEQANSNIQTLLFQLLEKTTPDSHGNLWDALHRLQTQRLTAIAKNVRLPLLLVEDIVQDVWAKVLPQWDSLRGPGGARRFLALTKKMMHDAVVDAIRKRDQHRTESLDSLREEPQDDHASDHLDSLMGTDLREWVAAGLSELEKAQPGYAWLLREHILKERLIKELAEEKKVSPHALHCRKTRALKKLGQLLGIDPTKDAFES